MQLNVLTRSDVREIPRISLRNLADHSQLRARQNAIWKTNAHHKELGGFALSADASRSPHTIALRINAPPLEIEPGPLGKDRTPPILRKLANLVPGIPGILGKFQTLGSLGLGLFDNGCGGSAHAWHPCCRLRW